MGQVLGAAGNYQDSETSLLRRFDLPPPAASFWSLVYHYHGFSKTLSAESAREEIFSYLLIDHDLLRTDGEDWHPNLLKALLGSDGVSAGPNGAFTKLHAVAEAKSRR